MPHRLYVPCGKIGCSRHTGLCGKIGCSRHIELCGKTTAGLDTDLVVDSLSFLLASELCSMTPTPSRLQTAIPATQARRPGLRSAAAHGNYPASRGDPPVVRTRWSSRNGGGVTPCSTGMPGTVRMSCVGVALLASVAAHGCVYGLWPGLRIKWFLHEDSREHCIPLVRLSSHLHGSQ